MPARLRPLLTAGLLGLLTLFSGWALAGPKIEHWTTDNGSRVYFVASPTLPILDVRVDFAAGRAYEPAERAGLAALTAGLLDSGASLAGSPLNEEQIAERLADVAASLASSTDADRSGLQLRTLSDPAQREPALALMQAVLSAPSFPQAALAREQQRLAAAIEEAETQPGSIAERRFRVALYAQHPYGHQATAESVRAISRDDVVNFWQQHYNATHAVVSIIGAISRSEAEALATRLTAQLPVSQQPRAALPPVRLPAAQTLKFAHPATQSHILIGLPAVTRHDADLFPLLVGNYVLGGGGFVSRLMNEVREKRGYAYGVYSHFEPYQLPGPFQIGLQTKRAQAQPAMTLVHELLERFLKEGPSAAELRAAKQNLIDGLALRLDSNAKLMGYVAMIGYYQLPLTYLDDYAAKVEAVMRQQVREAFARHVRPEHLVTVMVATD